MAVVNIAHPDLLRRIADYCSSWRKMICVFARIIRLGISSGPLTAEYLRRARNLLIKFAQK